MPGMIYIVSLFNRDEFSCNQSCKDFIDKAKAAGFNWIILPNGRSMEAKDIRSVKPKYTLTEWVRDKGGEAEEYKQLVKPNLPNTKLLNS